MKDNVFSKVRIGDYMVDFDSGLITPWQYSPSTKAQQSRDINPEESIRLEPKSSQVLQCLALNNGRLVSKDSLIQKVWPNQYVSDDTLLRTISRLRASLNDDPKDPAFIETLPKRGYRLIAPVEFPKEESVALRYKTLIIIVFFIMFLLLAFVIWFSQSSNSPSGPKDDLLAQADDYYHQMRLADNEMAITLYQQQLTLHPNSAEAYAGLANALVQRALRWSGDAHSEIKQADVNTLTAKVISGALNNQAAQAQLKRARTLAEKAVALRPNSIVALKALGFVLSAQGDFDGAIKIYQGALELDVEGKAWPVLINLGELKKATGEPKVALTLYEHAFFSMEQQYSEQEVQIRPWIASLAALMGEHYRELGEYQVAETWYRRAIKYAPLHEKASIGLAKVFHVTGDSPGALDLCETINQRLKTAYACRQLFPLEEKIAPSKEFEKL